MVYIRAKKIKSDQYLYLVKSVWDSEKNTSKQEIIKYLGKASKVGKEDIPIDYRNNPKVIEGLEANQPNSGKKNGQFRKKTQKLFYKKLIEGNIQECIKIHNEYNKKFKSPDFFDMILKPVMHKIGEDWAYGKISIGEEHVASNVAQILIRKIMSQISISRRKKKILLCVPLGEEHHLGCDVLETFLTDKGFRVYNMRTSLPTKSILNFINLNKPDIIFVSITLEENIPAGERLVKKIQEHVKTPIFLGGSAFQTTKTSKVHAKIIENDKLNDILNKIRYEING